jgi:hypothetical protein
MVLLHPQDFGLGRRHDLTAADCSCSGGAIRIPYAYGRRTEERAWPVTHAKPAIVLGSFGVGSGPLGALVAPIPVAVRAWAADVNTRGGLGGHGEPPTRPSIVSGLASLDHETLGGLVPPIAFPDGDRVKVNLCIVPLRFENGRFRPLGGDDGNFRCAPGWAPARRT